MAAIDRKEKRVLLVSSDAQCRQALKVALSDQGYQVHLCGDASDARQQAAAVRPDVLLVDIGDQEETAALELVHAARTDNPRLQCVLICDARLRLEPNVADEDWICIVRKPFSMMQFAAALDAAANRV